MHGEGGGFLFDGVGENWGVMGIATPEVSTPGLRPGAGSLNSRPSASLSLHQDGEVEMRRVYNDIEEGFV